MEKGRASRRSEDGREKRSGKKESGGGDRQGFGAMRSAGPRTRNKGRNSKESWE